ncbi:MAG: response regulator [Methylobacterium sp.]|nr:response regulator [Methylobacterium sp.]
MKTPHTQFAGNRNLHPLQRLAQAWQDLPLSFKGICVIVLPLAVLLISLGSLYVSELKSTRLENQLEDALQNQRDIQAVHTQLLEASTGVRDYLLTGDKHFLNIFFEAEKMLPRILAKLEERAGSAQQKQRLSVISPLVSKNLADLKALSQHEAAVASDPLIAQFKSQVDTLDRLRKEIEALNAEEALLVEQDQKEIFLQRQKNIVVTLIATLAGIIGSLMAVWVFSRTIVKRVRLLRDSAGHLARGEALDLPSSSRDELGQLSEELDHASQLLANNISDAIQARHEAEEASASKSMFLSRTSHELRTPLNAILGFAQLLEEDLPAGKQLNSVLLIKGAGQHLLKLINEVLEIARIDSGEASLELAPTMINDLLEEATHYIAPMGKIRDIEIQSEVAPALWATANRQKLLQVVLNLLSNALKYGPVGSVVQLNAYRRDDRIIIEVQDAGPGIPRALRERVFTPFDRLGAENTKVEGTGLGLALSKQIMLAMQGSIHLAEVGSLFWLEMASCAPDIPAPAVEPGTGRTRPLQLADRHSILYVEDNMSNRALVEAIILRQPDLRIHCVSTIKQATEYLAEVTPSLILIDLNLPDGSGERLVEHVHAEPRLRQIPMMILSADALPESINRLKAAGVAHYMTKPLDVAMFNKQVRELIQAQEAS